MLGQMTILDADSRHNMDMAPTTTPAGTQAVSRAAAVLRAVSAAAPEPVSSARLAATIEVSRPTAHRIAGALAAEGLLDRVASGWLLGPELYIMGSVAARRFDVSADAAEHLRAIARATGESVFLSARRGDETVCLLREEGSFPLRSMVLHEGIRFPLGVASAGLAILSMLPDPERAEFIAAVDLEPGWGASHARGELAARVERARIDGYAVNPGLIVEGSWGIGVAVMDGEGRPAWALSVTGVESRFRPERQRELGRVLMAHAHDLSQRLARPSRSSDRS